jgi:hypothetical protein
MDNPQTQTTFGIIYRTNTYKIKIKHITETKKLSNTDPTEKLESSRKALFVYLFA